MPVAQENASENVVAPEAYGRSFAAAVSESPRMHPDDLARLAELVRETTEPAVGKCRCTAQDKDVIPPGAMYATARQLARRYQIDVDDVYADPGFFRAVERPGKTGKRYCIATADANWAAHSVETKRGPRRARRTTRRPRTHAGPPLADFV